MNYSGKAKAPDVYLLVLSCHFRPTAKRESRKEIHRLTTMISLAEEIECESTLQTNHHCETNSCQLSNDSAGDQHKR